MLSGSIMLVNRERSQAVTADPTSGRRRIRS
jgi:hypothetical protein